MDLVPGLQALSCGGYLREVRTEKAKIEELGLEAALAAALAAGEGPASGELLCEVAGSVGGSAAALRVYPGGSVGLGPGALVGWGDLGPRGGGCVLAAAPVSGHGGELVGLVSCPALLSAALLSAVPRARPRAQGRCRRGRAYRVQRGARLRRVCVARHACNAAVCSCRAQPHACSDAVCLIRGPAEEGTDV